MKRSLFACLLAAIFAFTGCDNSPTPEPPASTNGISGKILRDGQGVNGIDITLTAADGTKTTATSGSDGAFTFSGLADGTYSLNWTPNGLIGGYTAVSAVAGSLGGTVASSTEITGITVSGGAVGTGYEFVVQRTTTPPPTGTASISGTTTVYDADAGDFAAGNTGPDDPNFSGGRIELFKQEGDGSFTATGKVINVKGAFKFDGLAAGTYQLQGTGLDGYQCVALRIINIPKSTRELKDGVGFITLPVTDGDVIEQTQLTFGFMKGGDTSSAKQRFAPLNPSVDDNADDTN